MRLITYCKSCKKSTPINSRGILLRTDLEDKYGIEVPYQCKHCVTTQKTHPNQIYAQSSKLPMVFTSIVGFLFLIIGFFILGAIIISAGFISLQSSNATLFNKSTVFQG
ncbi:MAG: hypothetical protein P1U56_03815 [Saprospiraceae bacterium]|nr:hypothetical protein [Saprospiraceae bacterium]